MSDGIAGFYRIETCILVFMKRSLSQRCVETSFALSALLLCFDIFFFPSAFSSFITFSCCFIFLFLCLLFRLFRSRIQIQIVCVCFFLCKRFLFSISFLLHNSSNRILNATTIHHEDLSTIRSNTNHTRKSMYQM